MRVSMLSHMGAVKEFLKPKRWKVSIFIIVALVTITNVWAYNFEFNSPHINNIFFRNGLFHSHDVDRLGGPIDKLIHRFGLYSYERTNSTLYDYGPHGNLLSNLARITSTMV